ncbi:hypothetical protein BJ741DRAFT_190279 [Chytriomyces cf. hyalinus JEL632]|nr:hypothetical protein BJ741DRAFT_190279 [Chytriomyces cf. hyalinus JEL632]
MLQPTATAPNDYNATFSKHERAEFSYKLLQLVRLNSKFRNAVSQLAAAAHDLSGGFKDLKRGRVKDGVLAHAQSIDAISDSYLAFAQTLSAVGPKAIQTFEGPIQGIANSYVSSYSNMDRECHTRMTSLNKLQKRVEKELASPWPWKRISGSYSEQQLTRDLSAVLAEKEQLSAFYVSRVYAQDVDTIEAVSALGGANLQILQDALGGWTAGGWTMNGLKDREVGCDAVAILRSPTVPSNYSQFTSPAQDVSPHLYPAMTHAQSSHSQDASSQQGSLAVRSSTMPRLGTTSREAAATNSKEVAHPSPKSFHSAEFSPKQTRMDLKGRMDASNLPSIFTKESVSQSAKLGGGTVTPMSLGSQSAEKSADSQPASVFEDLGSTKIEGNGIENNESGNRDIQEDPIQANKPSLLPVVHSSPQISDDLDSSNGPPNSRTSDISQDTLRNSVSTEHLRSLVSVENASRAAAMLASSATLPHPKAPSSSSSAKMGLKSALRSSGFDSFPRSASTIGSKFASTPVLSQNVATMKDRSYTVGGGGSHLDTSEESQTFGRVRRKSVHFTNPHGPMVEFWDGSTGHAEEVMSISNASLSGDEQDVAAPQEEVQLPGKPPAPLRARPMDIDTMRSLYPDMFITESRRMSSTPVQYVENTFFSENEAQRRVGPPVFFPPQADVQSEAGSVVGHVEMGASQHMAGRVLFIAIYKHVPKETKEMAMEKGDVLEIAKRSGKWVLATKVAASADRGSTRVTESGWVPAAFVMKYSLQ